jgi:hypothetical protein
MIFSFSAPPKMQWNGKNLGTQTDFTFSIECPTVALYGAVKGELC